MALPRIGILGGMGPAATILLQQRILDVMKVESDRDHLPLLVDMNTQVPSRIDFLIHGRGENPGPVLGQMAKTLESNGVDVLAMPCCTAHHFANDIVDSVSIPFLNMVELATADIAQRLSQGSGVGVLASPATQKIGLFKKELERCGLEERYPADADAMLAAIESIKKSGPDAAVVEYVQTVIAELEQTQVKAIVVGCSEFSLISHQISSRVPIVDAVSVLAQAIADWQIDIAEPGAVSA